MIVGCDIGDPNLRTKHELSFLHLRFQLSSVYCARIGSELLVSLARVRLVNGDLVWATKRKIT